MAGRMGQSRGQGASWATQEFSGPLFFPPGPPKTARGRLSRAQKPGHFQIGLKKNGARAAASPATRARKIFLLKNYYLFFAPRAAAGAPLGAPRGFFF